MTEPTLVLQLREEPQTIALGAALGEALRSMPEAIEAKGLAIWLAGDLGAGKTTLVRALLQQLGMSGPVKSPSFALLEPYEISRLHLYHFDFYRFKNPREFVESGFSEFFRPGNVCLVEWPERAGQYLPPADLSVRLELLEAGRSAAIDANTEIGERCLHQLRAQLTAARAGA